MITIIDGRSGAGKTTFAERIAGGDRVIHMDSLYAGWHGLHEGTAIAERIVVQHAAGRAVTWQEWDWAADARGAEHTLLPHESVVIEGCGSLTPVTAALADRSFWLEAPEGIRRARALERDKGDWWWELWRAQEDEHIAAHDPRSLATEVVDAA